MIIHDWIRVDYRSPAKIDWYLIKETSEGMVTVFIAYWNGKEWMSGDDNDAHLLPAVTHWTYLPKP